MECNVLNINVGVLGHVDSGKTSLCKQLSEIPSTAAFDKNPQSQERGITLDLGFSSFNCEMPSHLNQLAEKKLQVTLVDCPGHSSLFKTVIGGCKIIDIILLVIDITKGIELQTAECIILASILNRPVIVALNKVDLATEKKFKNKFESDAKKMKKILQAEGLDVIGIVPVTASEAAIQKPEYSFYSPKELKNAIIKLCKPPPRSAEGLLLFAVDHCFGIKGQGTVMTGTVIRGSLKQNENIYIVGHDLVRQVKSLQIFKRPVSAIKQGDRAAISVSRFDHNLFERGLVCSSSSQVTLLSAAFIKPSFIKHYKQEIKSGAKISLSIGFEVVTSEITFLEAEGDFTTNDEFQYLPTSGTDINRNQNIICYLKFAQPTICEPDTLLIGVTLNPEPTKKMCRIMFYGQNFKTFSSSELHCDCGNPPFKIYTWKTRIGKIDRICPDHLIVKGMFGSNSRIDKYCFHSATLSTGDVGIIQGRFGQGGRIKLGGFNMDSISNTLKEIFALKNLALTENITIEYKYKKYRKFIY